MNNFELDLGVNLGLNQSNRKFSLNNKRNIYIIQLA